MHKAILTEKIIFALQLDIDIASARMAKLINFAVSEAVENCLLEFESLFGHIYDKGEYKFILVLSYNLIARVAKLVDAPS